MDRVTVEYEGGAMRYTRSDSNPFRWVIESRHGDGAWTPMPDMSETIDGRDILWSLAAMVLSGTKAVSGSVS